jgi:hypothetical protein
VAGSSEHDYKSSASITGEKIFFAFSRIPSHEVIVSIPYSVKKECKRRRMESFLWASSRKKLVLV